MVGSGGIRGLFFDGGTPLIGGSIAGLNPVLKNRRGRDFEFYHVKLLTMFCLLGLKIITNSSCFRVFGPRMGSAADQPRSRFKVPGAGKGNLLPPSCELEAPPSCMAVKGLKRGRKPDPDLCFFTKNDRFSDGFCQN